MLAQFRTPALAVTIGVAAVVAPVLSLVAPAQAATAGHGGSALASAHTRAVSVINSDHFAGYEANVTAGSATTSAAQFKIPALTCTSAFRAITPVAGVSVTFNNAATYSSAFLFVGCQNGKALYFPALVINGTETNYNTTHLAAGDVIKVSTKVTTAGTTVQVADVTKSITKKLTGPAASPTSAYIADSGWYINGSPLGVPKFGTLTFSHCSVDGKTLASAHPTKVQRVNSSNVVQITTGALSPAGTAFATHFKHA